MQPAAYERSRGWWVGRHTWEEAGLKHSEQNAADHETGKGLSDALTDRDDT
jgi:hypothetical protein